MAGIELQTDFNHIRRETALFARKKMCDRKTCEFALLLGLDPKTLPDSEAFSAAKVTIADPRELDAEEAALTDAEYEMLEPYLPPDPVIEGALKNRKILGALLWARATGRALTHIPSHYGSSEAVRKRAERWAIAGVWDRLTEVIPTLDLSRRSSIALLALSSKYRMRGDRIRNRRHEN